MYIYIYGSEFYLLGFVSYLICDRTYPVLQLIIPRIISNIILSTMRPWTDYRRESLLKICSFERELSKKLMTIKLSMENYKEDFDRFEHASSYQPVPSQFYQHLF